jgi:hypothetical protein
MAPEPEAVRGDDDERRTMEALQAEPPSTMNWSRGSGPLLLENPAGFAPKPPFYRPDGP